MPHTKPRDPESLAAMLIALRLFADGVNPSNEFERAMVGSMQRTNASQIAAKQLVANFDRLPARMRARALGPFESLTTPRRRSVTAPVARRSATGGAQRVFDLRGGASTDSSGPATAIVDHDSTKTFTYEITYQGFVCDKEVGDPGDFIVSTSDEVYAITSAVHINPDGTNEVLTLKHPYDRTEYEDVDIGDTYLGPVVACWRGTNRQLPVSLTVVAYERDLGDPNTYRDEIDTAVKAAVALGIYLGLGGSPAAAALAAVSAFVSEFITDVLNWLISTGDDQVGSPRTMVLTVLDVERLGRRGRRRHIHEIELLYGEVIREATDLRCHFKSQHSGLGGRYTFGFDIERTPPFVEEEPIVD